VPIVVVVEALATVHAQHSNVHGAVVFGSDAEATGMAERCGPAVVGQRMGGVSAHARWMVGSAVTVGKLIDDRLARSAFCAHHAGRQRLQERALGQKSNQAYHGLRWCQRNTPTGTMGRARASLHGAVQTKAQWHVHSLPTALAPLLVIMPSVHSRSNQTKCNKRSGTSR